MKSLSNEIRRARPLLGTLVEIGAAGENAALAIEAAFREIEIIHRLMSFHETDSDIARLNRAPLLTAQQVDPRTYEVLSWAQKISALSDGAFDITVGGKLVAAGFLPKPEDAEWPSEEANFRDLSLLSDNRVLLDAAPGLILAGLPKAMRSIERLQRSNATASTAVL